MPNSRKRRVDFIIIRLANGIEFMIVASSATERHPQKCLARGVDDFI